MLPKGFTSDMLQETTTTGSNVFTMNPDDLGSTNLNVVIPPKGKEITYPPLGINPDIVPQPTGGIKTSTGILPTGGIKTSTDMLTTGGVKTGVFGDCLNKWEQVALVSRFSSQEEMEKAKKIFITDCITASTTSVSTIVEPALGLPSNPVVGSGNTEPNLGAFLGSLSGGGAGAESTNEEQPKTDCTCDKYKFPYWILAVAVVGGYLIYRKK
jgi:hypothetical protein